MRKKELLVLTILFISIFIFAQLVYAENTTITKDEKAYDCLIGKVKNKCSSLTLEEKTFSLLALSYNEDIGSECFSALNSEKSEAGCFPKSSCTVKDTSQAVIALNYVRIPTADSEGWILGKRIKAKSLVWYLEIDTKEASSCTVKYGSTTKVDIDVNKKISSVSGGDCLSKSSNGYWLKISDSCLSKNYTIECNKDFISTLLYQKDGSDVWYVSSDVKSASAKSTTEHSIDSYCFSKTSDCDYEASLWAVFALKKTGNNVKPYLPYIIAFVSDNKKYFPQPFLYLLTDSEDYLADTITLQKTSGYWDVGGIRGKFYDTALGLLITQSSDATTTAKEWLFDNQDSSGCWNNNLKDTAFLLYSGWPKTPVKLQGAIEKSGCITSGYYCVLSDAACENANGNILDSTHQCSGIRTCCSKPEELESCDSQDGTECVSGKVCDEAEVIALDTNDCCLGTCKDPNTIITECASQGTDYNCRTGTSCFSGEQPATLYDCNTGSICCKAKPVGKSSALIWILIILIIILALAIIFRNRIKVFFFKKSSGVSTSNVSKSRPPFYPPSSGQPARMQMPRFIPTTATRTPPRRDKELEETMRKLKEMSK